VLHPQEALKVLLEGNARWVRGEPEHPRQTIERRLEVADHQEPFAVVFSCIDSRVPPEIVFDCGLGDLFVVRTGGEALDDMVVLGSPEFGPSGYDSARLIMVLGHKRCGAIIAAIESIETGVPAPGHISAVVDALRPAYHAAVGRPGDLVENMVSAQVELTVEALRADPLLADLAADDGLVIVGARYDLESGAVEIIA
jgi:carbonic anhydrase